MFGAVHFTGQQQRMAPATLATATVGRGGNAVFFQRLQKCIARAGGDGLFLPTDADRDFYLCGDGAAIGVIRQLLRVVDFALQFMAHPFTLQMQRFDLLNRP